MKTTAKPLPVSKRVRSDVSESSLRSTEAVTAKVQSLAEWLIQDIRRRGLRPGDRYLTSEEAARLLDVSTGTAHQAMRVLVDQDILSRRRKQGTFVGPAMDPPPTNVRPRVYIVSPADAIRDASYSRLSEAIYPAISNALGGATLQLEYLPQGDTLGFVRALVDEAEEAGNLGGFLLLRATYEIQDFFNENHNRIPAVVVGSVYPGITDLPWIDADQKRIGESVAEYALGGGHRRMAVLMNEHWAPGDSVLMTGMAQSLETAPERLDRFDVCSLPAYERSTKDRVRGLLSGNDRPTVIVARMALQVRAVFEVAEELGLRIPDDVEVIFANLGNYMMPSVSVPRAESEMGMSELGEQVGKMLVALRTRELRRPLGTVLPIRFVQRQS